MKRSADRFAIAEFRLLEGKIDRAPLRVEWREQHAHRAKLDFPAFVADLPSLPAAIEKLAGRVEKPPLPDPRDGEDARVEAVVEAIRQPNMDRPTRKIFHRPALNAHAVTHQQL